VSISLDYTQATFLVSASRLDQCPADTGAEIAFAGRSNAGKSSAINTLTQNRKLARTSKTPGRTQLINFFSLNDDQRLVDLPGYGYAKVPEKVRRDWQHHIDDYLRYRESLAGVVLVMDIRHPFKPFDAQMVEWASKSDMPLHILLTKADKLKRGPAKRALLQVKTYLKQQGGVLSAQLFSATQEMGREELCQYLDTWLNQPDMMADKTVSEEPDPE